LFSETAMTVSLPRNAPAAKRARSTEKPVSTIVCRNTRPKDPSVT